MGIYLNGTPGFSGSQVKKPIATANSSAKKQILAEDDRVITPNRVIPPAPVPVIQTPVVVAPPKPPAVIQPVVVTPSQAALNQKAVEIKKQILAENDVIIPQVKVAPAPPPAPVPVIQTPVVSKVVATSPIIVTPVPAKPLTKKEKKAADKAAKEASEKAAKAAKAAKEAADKIAKAAKEAADKQAKQDALNQKALQIKNEIESGAEKAKPKETKIKGKTPLDVFKSNLTKKSVEKKGALAALDTTIKQANEMKKVTADANTAARAGIPAIQWSLMTSKQKNEVAKSQAKVDKTAEKSKKNLEKMIKKSDKKQADLAKKTAAIAAQNQALHQAAASTPGGSAALQQMQAAQTPQEIKTAIQAPAMQAVAQEIKADVKEIAKANGVDTSNTGAMLTELKELKDQGVIKAGSEEDKTINALSQLEIAKATATAPEAPEEGEDGESSGISKPLIIGGLALVGLFLFTRRRS